MVWLVDTILHTQVQHMYGHSESASAYRGIHMVKALHWLQQRHDESLQYAKGVIPGQPHPWKLLVGAAQMHSARDAAPHTYVV